MSAFAPRRSTESQISDAITLGWRIARLYSLRANELPNSPPDNLLPMRRSLPADQRLALELRAAAGDAARLDVALAPDELDELLALAMAAPDGAAEETRFLDRIRRWHVHLATMLWADHEATGKAYELGTFLADTSNRVIRELRDRRASRARVTQELRCVFERERVERIKRLLDDLQARIDPAAARIVKQHLAAWQEAAATRTLIDVSRAGLDGLDNQSVIWFQLVTGNKEPEAFIGHDDRARVRESMIARLARSYAANWRGMSAAMVTAAVSAVGVILVAYGAAPDAEVLAPLAPVAGALGLKITSIGLTVRKSLDARAELLWNTALVDVISAKTLRVDDVLAALPPRRRLPLHAGLGRRSQREAPPAVAAAG